MLAIRLLDGKVTYIHESLFDDLYAIVSEVRDWQLRKIKSNDQAVLKYILKKGKVFSNDSALSELTQKSKKSLDILEKNLLLYSTEEHMESGQHIKVFKPWKKSKIFTKSSIDYEIALNRFNIIIDKLNRESGSTAKSPWNIK